MGRNSAHIFELDVSQLTELVDGVVSDFGGDDELDEAHRLRTCGESVSGRADRSLRGDTHAKTLDSRLPSLSDEEKTGLCVGGGGEQVGGGSEETAHLVNYISRPPLARSAQPRALV